MKIRQGFVSNSSSSSFIIMAKGETATVRDVAKIMINDLISEIDTERYYPDWEDLILYKKSWIEKMEKIDENHPIHFPSTNYDTWIRKAGDRILISTCNNNTWYIPNQTRSLTEESMEDLKNYLTDENYNKFMDYDYDFYLDSYFNDFYSLKFEIVGRKSPSNYKDENYNWDDNYCKKIRNSEICNTHLWETKMGNKCPICDKPILDRSEKLKQIKKIEKYEN